MEYLFLFLSDYSFQKSILIFYIFKYLSNFVFNEKQLVGFVILVVSDNGIESLSQFVNGLEILLLPQEFECLMLRLFKKRCYFLKLIPQRNTFA